MRTDMWVRTVPPGGLRDRQGTILLIGTKAELDECWNNGSILEGCDENNCLYVVC